MSERALAAAICPKRYGSSTIGVKKSTDCRSRPPPNGTYPASSRVSIPLTKPSAAAGASPFSTCSRSPGANLEAQPAFCEYFVSLMRVFSSTGRLYPSPLFGTGPPPPDSLKPPFRAWAAPDTDVRDTGLRGSRRMYRRSPRDRALWPGPSRQGLLVVHQIVAGVVFAQYADV